MVHKHNQSSTKKLVWAGAASGLLFALCWLVSYTGSVYAFSSKTPILTPEVMTPTVKPTPLVIVVNSPSATQPNPQGNIVITILVALLSGSVGAIIGSVIGAKINNNGLMQATEKQADSLFQATKQQIESLYAQEKGNREYAEQQQDKAMRHALLIEAQENLILAQSYVVATYFIKLSTEAWGIYKADIKKLPDPLQGKILQAYIEIGKYNSLAEKARFEQTSMVDPQAKKVAPACQAVIDELEKLSQ